MKFRLVIFIGVGSRDIWIIVNVGLGPKFEEQGHLHQLAFEKLGLSSLVVDSPSITVEISSPSLLYIDGAPVQRLPKAVIMQSKDPLTATAFATLGVPTINSAETITTCDDKRLTHIALARANIPSPRTLLPSFLYPNQCIPPHLVRTAGDQLGYPLVVKEARGSFGSQVHLVPDEGTLSALASQLGNTPYLLQQYIRSSHGRDLRVQVVGQRCVAAMERRADNEDMRANLSQGAYGRPYALDPQEESLALQACAAVGAINAGVDLLFDQGGARYVVEVNSNAHVARISRITGVDCALELAKYVKDIYLS